MGPRVGRRGMTSGSLAQTVAPDAVLPGLGVASLCSARSSDRADGVLGLFASVCTWATGSTCTQSAVALLAGPR
jgi:hypothetical protein